MKWASFNFCQLMLLPEKLIPIKHTVTRERTSGFQVVVVLMGKQLSFEIRTSKILILITVLSIFKQGKLKKLTSSERQKSKLP